MQDLNSEILFFVSSFPQTTPSVGATGSAGPAISPRAGLFASKEPPACAGS